MGTEKQNISDSKALIFKDILQIIQFFLNLFKAQLGVPENAATSFKLIGKQSTGSRYIYELTVEDDGKQDSRRMSVGTLGEDSGSKSKCYDVIYDDHIVVKIPPIPTTDFAKYIKSINADRLIANRLAPKECIVPGVSVILKRVHNFPDRANLTPMELEERYVKLLQIQPSVQEYLKIGDAFVFFMDLAEYFMFSDVLDKMHEGDDEKILEEITNHFCNIQEFEGRYGPANESLCYDIKNIYQDYESDVKSLQASSNVSQSVVHYKLHEWFSIHMVNQEVVENEKELPTQFVSALNSLIKNKLDENKDTVETYREVIKSYVYSKKFRTDKPQMMGIITNILELLAWLGERKVAMRDLKPDNLLVIGDKSKYPTFLKSSAQFKMGLIDVETAAVIEAKDGEQIKQPQIGGTPFFATPSHLLKNKYLKATFEDLPSILHYQDWYAAIVMIYYVVTGERLFIQTAKLFPGIKKKLKETVKNKKPLPEAIANLSGIFWRSATHEFKLKTDKQKRLLASLEIAIPINAVKMLRKAIFKEIENISQKIKHTVIYQKKFKGDKNHQYLLQSDYNQISQLKTKWENKTAAPKATPEDRAEVIKFLQGLMKLKLQSEQQEVILELLKKSKPKISAHALMKLMFNIVLQSMYKDEWEPFWAADSTVDNSQSDDESLYGVTIL
jgi:serine/threonine protein kinase